VRSSPSGIECREIRSCLQWLCLACRDVRVGLLAIGVAFTLIAYISSYDVTLVIMSAISILYPLAARRILRDNPIPSDSSEAVRRGATILGVVWMIVATGLAVFWLSGILTEWSYFSGKRLLGLLAAILLMHVVSSVVMHLIGRFVR
jgi:hypothetical protein